MLLKNETTHMSEPNTKGERQNPEILLSRYCKNTLSEQDADEFLELLDRHPEYYEILWKHVLMEVALRDITHAGGDVPNEIDMLSKIDPSFDCADLNVFRRSQTGFSKENNPVGFSSPLALTDHDFEAIPKLEEQIRYFDFSTDVVEPKPAEETISKNVVSPSRIASRSEPSVMLRLCVTVLIAFFLFGIYQEFSRTPSKENTRAQGFAKVTALAHPEFNEQSLLFKKGQVIGQERIVLEKGSMEIKLDNHVCIVLEGPADLQLNSLKKAFCNQGRLSVFVPPEASGYELATPHLTVRDIGTRFFVDAGEEKSDVHVVQGKVEVNWLAKEWVSLTENLGVRVRSPYDIKQIAADLKLYVTPELMKFRSDSYENELVRRNRIIHNRLQSDPSLRLFFTASDLDFRGRNIRTYACRSIPGSMETAALKLVNKSSFIEAGIDRSFDSLTMIATVNLDRCDKTQALFFCKDFYEQPNRCSRQIDRFGRLQFHLRSHASNIVSFETEPLLKKRDCGLWLTLALVFDPKNKLLKHYIDGREVARFTCNHDWPITMTSAMLGNEIAEKKYTNLFLEGAIESFYLFDRPCSEEEIRKIICSPFVRQSE